MTSISVAAGVATAVEYLVRALKKLNEIRAVKDQMQELGFEQEFLDKLNKKGEAAVDAEIEQIDAEIFQDHKIDNDGRINEIRTGIKLHLKGLAARLERGYSVEVRTELPPEPTEDEKRREERIATLSQIRFQQTTPLLKLTDGENEPPPSRKAPAEKTVSEPTSPTE